MKTEYLNLYDRNGNLLECKGIRGEKNDNLYGVAIIYIENNKGEFLIQKTSASRGSIYATTGGHVDYGDDFYDTIIKEVKEELGLDVSNDGVKEICSYFIEHFYLKTYYLKKDVSIEDINIKEDEVEFVKWMSIEEIDSLIKAGKFRTGNIEGFNAIKNLKISENSL